MKQILVRPRDSGSEHNQKVVHKVYTLQCWRESQVLIRKAQCKSPPRNAVASILFGGLSELLKFGQLTAQLRGCRAGTLRAGATEAQ